MIFAIRLLSSLVWVGALEHFAEDGGGAYLTLVFVVPWIGFFVSEKGDAS